MKHIRIIAPDLAIDLGTANTIVARLDKGVVIEEPTVVALNYQRMEILAIGKEAKELIGKSPDEIVAVRPLEDGVISDFDLTQAMLEYFIHKAVPGISVVAPRVMISVPSGATDVENRAIQDAVLQSGARDVYLVEESLASAYGAGLIDRSTRGVMVLNVGAGTTEAAVVSGYGVITSKTLKNGGDNLDRAIREYIREKYDLVIGENTAEEVKKRIASLNDDGELNAMEVGGRDLVTGMPKSIDVYAMDIRSAILPFIENAVDLVRSVLEKTPPELAADIIAKGLILTGGGSQIDGFDRYIAEQVNVRVRSSKSPLVDTINGAQILMKNIDQWKDKGDKHDSVQEK